MTAREEANRMRQHFHSERICAEDIGYWLGISRKTAEKEVAHLEYYRTDSGQKRYRVMDVAEMIICKTERRSI